MRKAFSMITAIFVVILMATVAILILNLSSKTVKATTMQYKHEQAVLYAKSYTELGIMFATANDAQSGATCAENINGTVDGNATAVDKGDGYDIETRISYIGNSLVCSSIGTLNDQTSPIVTNNELQVIIDVYVRYRDPEVMAIWGGTIINAPWVTYHRRTLQKL